MAESAKDMAAKESADAAKKETPRKEQKDSTSSIDENEIRVTAQGKMRNYVTYAASLFTDKKQTTVVLKGMGRVINKTVSLAEVLKRRVKGLYQLTEIGSVEVTDNIPPEDDHEEGKQLHRLLSVISIVLTTEPTEDSRYQTPLPDEEVEPLKKLPPRRGRGRGTLRRRVATGRPTKTFENGAGADNEPLGGGRRRGVRGLVRGGRGGRRGRGRGRGRRTMAPVSGHEDAGGQAPQTAAA